MELWESFRGNLVRHPETIKWIFDTDSDYDANASADAEDDPPSPVAAANKRARKKT